MVKWTVASLAGLALGCAGGSGGGLDARYERAVADARRGSVPPHAALVALDACADPAATVTVATWRDGPLPTRDGALIGDVWVTVVPELRRRCSAFHASGDALDLHVRQLLGLPPRWKSDRVSVFTARCGDVFRPCRDPETTDRVCDDAFRPDVVAAHRTWFAHEVNDAFGGEPRFPWTARGYTCDWAAASGCLVGPSEFIVRRGALVTGLTESATAAYCVP